MEKRNSSQLIVALIALLVCSTFDAYTQTIEKQIEVGQWVTLAACKKGSTNFESMDLYTKTRFPESGILIDSVSGYGIFEHFFAPGDFDAKRLPCSFAKKQYKIAALREFDIEGKVKQVMILYTGDKYSLIWVEIEKAIDLNEVIF